MQTQAQQYNVAIKYKDGTLAYLSHRDRMSWTLRTARKHAKDCTAKIVSGVWHKVQYVAVVAA
jgi:hypothetical protein